MFVRKSKFDELARNSKVLLAEYGKLGAEYEKTLASKEFLERTNIVLKQEIRRMEARSFDQPDIKTLITLCHPDKHGGSRAANDITAKLLNMRDV